MVLRYRVSLTIQELQVADKVTFYINHFRGYSLIGLTNPTQRVSTRVGRSTQYNISLIGSKYLVREIAGSTPVYYILVN